MARTSIAILAFIFTAALGAGQASAYTDNDWMDVAFTHDDGQRSSLRRAAASSQSRADRAASRSPARRVVRTDSDSRSSDAPRGRSSGGGNGIASYYWQPQRLASGGWFNPGAMTAAHKTLPFGTKVRVTNLNNGRAAMVTINDRGPYVAGRVIDLSSAAAGAVGMKGSGLARVKLDVVSR